MTTTPLTVTAELEDHTTSVTIPAHEYHPTRGVWVRCATCGGCHLATVEGSA